MTDARADRDLLADAARAAGKLVLAFRARGMRDWEKNPGDPVSEADLASDALLKERLQGARPDYGWLSEETADDQSSWNAGAALSSIPSTHARLSQEQARIRHFLRRGGSGPPRRRRDL